MATPVVHYEANELVGLKFMTDKDIRECIRIHAHGPDGRGYFIPVGDNTVVLPKEKLPWLSAQLAAAGIKYTEVLVRSMGDLSPEEAADLRRRKRGYPGTLEDRERLLEELRRRYGVS